MRESMDKNRIQGVSVGRAGNLREAHIHQVRERRSGDCAQKAIELTREICSVSLRRLRLPRGILTAEQKSAEGILGHDVGKAIEALQG